MSLQGTMVLHTKAVRELERCLSGQEAGYRLQTGAQGQVMSVNNRSCFKTINCAACRDSRFLVPGPRLEQSEQQTVRCQDDI